MIRGFMPSRCLLTALELDIFTAVGDGANAEQIGAKIHANARAVGMLLNALVALGLLYKSGDDYKNTPESARFFVQGSKDNHRDGLLHTANIWHRWSTLTDAVRRGTRVPIESRHPRMDAQLHRRHATQRQGSRPDSGEGSGHHGRSPRPRSRRRLRRILDRIRQSCSEVRCEMLDIPEVVPLTAEYVSQAGVSTQVSVRAGDMLRDDFGSGYDVIMLNAICHMFSEQQNQDIFRRAHRALAPNGRLVVQDFILNPEKTAPQHAALFSLNMLVGTDGGASYSESEYPAG